MDFVILKVNGQDLSSASHNTILKAFESATDPIIVEVARQSSSPYLTKTNRSGEDLVRMPSVSPNGFDPNSRSKSFSVGSSGDLKVNGLSDEQQFEEEVVLRKSNPKEIFGLTLSYSTINETNSDSLVYISGIEPNTVADRSLGICVGDRILQINGVVVKSKNQVVNLFYQSTMEVKLTIARLNKGVDVSSNIGRDKFDLPTLEEAEYSCVYDEVLAHSTQSSSSCSSRSPSRCSVGSCSSSSPPLDIDLTGLDHHHPHNHHYLHQHQLDSQQNPNEILPSGGTTVLDTVALTGACGGDQDSGIGRGTDEATRDSSEGGDMGTTLLTTSCIGKSTTPANIPVSQQRSLFMAQLPQCSDESSCSGDVADPEAITQMMHHLALEYGKLRRRLMQTSTGTGGITIRAAPLSSSPSTGSVQPLPPPPPCCTVNGGVGTVGSTGSTTSSGGASGGNRTVPRMGTRLDHTVTSVTGASGAVLTASTVSVSVGGRLLHTNFAGTTQQLQQQHQIDDHQLKENHYYDVYDPDTQKDDDKEAQNGAAEKNRLVDKIQQDNNGHYPQTPLNIPKSVGSKMEWVIKRRADGTRYITRRPIRQQKSTESNRIEKEKININVGISNRKHNHNQNNGHKINSIDQQQQQQHHHHHIQSKRGRHTNYRRDGSLPNNISRSSPKSSKDQWLSARQIPPPSSFVGSNVF